jgi:hypothetical protein
VCAGVFFKTQSWRKLRRDRVFIVVKEKHRRLVSGGVTRLCCRRLSSWQTTLSNLQKFSEGRTDGWNSPWRIREIPRAVRSHRVARRLRWSFSASGSSGERGLYIHANEDRWIYSRNSISGFRGWKDRNFVIWIRETAKSDNPTRQKVSLWGQDLDTCWNPSVLAFRGLKGREEAKTLVDQISETRRGSSSGQRKKKDPVCVDFRPAGWEGCIREESPQSLKLVGFEYEFKA